MAGRYPKQQWQSGSVGPPYGPVSGARLQHIEDYIATIFDNFDAVVPLTPVAGGLFYNALTGLWENRLIKDSDVASNAAIAASKIAGAAPPGAGSLFFGPAANVPAGWFLCDGSAISRATYAALFAAIGATWGFGDGSTTFNLPDFRGRMPVGLGVHTDVDTLGKNEGVPTVGSRRPRHRTSLTDPTHAHSIYDPTHAHAISDPGHSHIEYIGAAGGGTQGAPSPNVYTSVQATAYATGVAATGIGIYGAGTGIGIYGAGTGISVGTGAGTDPLDSSPYLVTNIMIKT